MRLILNFIIGLICGSYAFEIEENHYKVLNGVKALSNVIERVSTHSSISCATKCEQTDARMLIFGIQPVNFSIKKFQELKSGLKLRMMQSVYVSTTNTMIF